MFESTVASFHQPCHLVKEVTNRLTRPPRLSYDLRTSLSNDGIRTLARQLVVHLECEVTELFPISGVFLGATYQRGKKRKITSKNCHYVTLSASI